MFFSANEMTQMCWLATAASGESAPTCSSSSGKHNTPVRLRKNRDRCQSGLIRAFPHRLLAKSDRWVTSRKYQKPPLV